MDLWRSIEYYSDYEWTMEQVYEVADKNIKRLQSQLDIANKKLEETKEYINKNIRHEYRNGRNNEFYLELNENKLKQLQSIIGGE